MLIALITLIDFLLRSAQNRKNVLYHKIAQKWQFKNHNSGTELENLTNDPIFFIYLFRSNGL